MKQKVKLAIGLAAAAVIALILFHGPKPEAKSGYEAKSGDKVWVNLTCHADGKLVIATDAAVANDQSQARSEIYVPLKKHDPLDILASPTPVRDLGLEYAQPTENELEYQLASAVLGMKAGEKAKLKIEASVPAMLSARERFLDFARVRVRPKLERVAYSEFRELMGDPAVGMDVPQALELPGRVVEVTNDEVVVQYETQEGAEVKTPLGSSIVKDLGDSFGLQIQIKVGEVRRVGPLVGQVIKVDEQLISMDFGHPFGGKTLDCDVAIAKIEPPKN